MSFGLVNVSVKAFTAVRDHDVHFHQLEKRSGSRIRNRKVAEKSGKEVDTDDIKMGFEVSKGRYVTFDKEELEELKPQSTKAVEVTDFVDLEAVDPIYYDKAYYLAPDKRGGKPYNLLMEAMRESGRCALAKWAWKGKQYVVQVRAAEDGLVLQQLLYADEVRSLKDLEIEQAEPSQAEVKLALQLIDQIAQDGYDPSQYVDEEKQRILAAIDAKIAGKQVVAAEERESEAGGQIIDLTEMLRASLARSGSPRSAAAGAEKVAALPAEGRKGVKRATAKAPAAEAPPARARSRK
jgi:DNA end-binding protein Ku